jgi:hypothetical protein
MATPSFLRSRVFWYVLFGIAPALPLLSFALVLGRFPVSKVVPGISVAWLAFAGFVGLCAAAVSPPRRERWPSVALVLVLLACGCLVTGTLLVAFAMHAARDWSILLSQPTTIVLFLAPTLVAIHYTWTALSEWCRGRYTP